LVDGTIEHEGMFLEGVAHGQGTRFDARTGTTVSGNFASGAPDGAVAVFGGDGTVSTRHYRDGQDRTGQVQQARARDIVTTALDEAVAAATARERTADRDRDIAREAYERERALTTSEGRAAAERQCYCFWEGGCLTVSRSDETREEREANRREYERRRDDCRRLRERLDDPNLASIVAALRQSDAERQRVLARARVDRERAEAERARTLQEVERQRGARLAEALRQAEAEGRAAAESRLREVRDRCAARGYRGCGCGRYAPGYRPNPNATASCQ
jgi:hypothetical protein